MPQQGQIIAMGGGGFTMEPDNPLLDRYVLAATGKELPRVCFVPTAAGDPGAYVDRFYEAFPGDLCEPTWLSLFNRRIGDLTGFLCEQDLVYVGGGNTVNLLAIWRAQGMDAAVAEALAAGTIFCGVSAGALCWFERGITDSYSPDLKPLLNGLGFLPGAFSPHYDSDWRRPIEFPAFVREHGFPALAAEDGVALHFRDGELIRAVTSRPGKIGIRFVEGGVGVRGVAIEPEYLGADDGR